MIHLGSNRYQCCDEYCPGSKDVTHDGDPIMCQNCGKQEATITWIGEGGSLAYVHGMGQEWCELCCVKEQLTYAAEQAARIPELKRRLKELLEDDND
jgi:hypothetical protein